MSVTRWMRAAAPLAWRQIFKYENLATLSLADQLRYRFVAAFSFISFWFYVGYIVVHSVTGNGVATAILVVSLLLLGPVVALLRRSRLDAAATLYVASHGIMFSSLALVCGGWRAPHMVWLVSVMPVVAFLLTGKRRARWLTVGIICIQVAVACYDFAGGQFPYQFQFATTTRAFKAFYLASVCGVPLCMMILLWNYESIRLRAERDLRAAQLAMVNATKMAALGEMSAGIAHEINNPLFAITASVHLLRKRAASGTLTDEELLSSIERVERVASRIAKIISGLRAFARESDADPFSNVPAATIVEDTLSLCTERFKIHDIEVSVDLGPAGLNLECRPVQISQVLLNLLSNAHDAVEDAPSKQISVGVRDLGSHVEFFVVDSGSGVPVDLREKIFVPFFTTKPVGRGTGLGLSLAHGIVESHKGSLSIPSGEKPTTFAFRIPKTPRS